MNLKFFTVDNEYCEFLRKTDLCVPYIHADKYLRPFVGIVLTVSGFDYFAPLTSPKPKHLNMNQLSWCNANKDKIIIQAEKLYHLIVTGKARPELAKRCCNFFADEKQYRKYCELHGLDI